MSVTGKENDMSPELWSNISYILLVTGIIFFTVTVILAVKFQLLSMLKADLTRSRKKIRMTPSEEYFAFVERKNRELSAIEEVSSSIEIKAVSEDVKPKVSVQPVPSDADDSPSATVVVSLHEAEETPAEGGTVITSGRMDEEGFRITDSIMIVHGDPHAVTI